MFKDANGIRFSLDSDEKIEFLFQSHHLNPQESEQSLTPFLITVEPDLGENQSLIDTTPAAPFQMECDGCTENLITGTGFKCLYCQCIQICETCETCGHHFAHFLLPNSVFKNYVDTYALAKDTDSNKT